MSSVDFKLGGASEFRKNLQAAAPRVRQEIKKALYQFAEEVMTDSKALVPVLTGTLMNTGHVELPVENGNLITVVLGYGGPAAPYALYVHEALEGSHPINPNWSWAKAAAAGKQIQWTRPGSGPKYLETPLKAKQGQLPGRVKAAMQRGLKGS